MFKKIKSKLKGATRKIIYNFSKKKVAKYNCEINIVDFQDKFESLNEVYQYFHHYFWNLAPVWLKEHRNYFSKERRAFGEDAFHSMWYLIFKELKPKMLLEIGVYRGSTLSLFSLLAKQLNINTEIHGISPFSPAGDSVSNYLTELDYYEDVIKNFNFFNLPLPVLHRGFSTDSTMHEVIKTNTWDLIFIDGNHDYDVAKQDFIVCSKNIRKGGFIVLDDSSLNRPYHPPFYSTAGHPGPSKVADEINSEEFEEIVSVGHNRVFKKL